MNPNINTQKDSEFQSDNYEYRIYEYKRVVTLKTNNKCISLAFNTNNTILFVGQDNEIKVLGLNQTKLIQAVFTLWKATICLIWRKKSNSLISGHKDKIIIWNKLSPLQILERKNLICMILNEVEDLLVSGNYLYNIQFRKKESKGWISSQMLKTSFVCIDLSFNASQNKLISCGSNSVGMLIVVIEHKNDNNWAITQAINFQEKSLDGRICFINDNKFAYYTSLINYYIFLTTIKRIINFSSFKEFKFNNKKMLPAYSYAIYQRKEYFNGKIRGIFLLFQLIYKWRFFSSEKLDKVWKFICIWKAFR